MTSPPDMGEPVLRMSTIRYFFPLVSQSFEWIPWFGSRSTFAVRLSHNIALAARSFPLSVGDCLVIEGIIRDS